MQQWNKSILVGCLLIAIALIISGSIVGQTISGNIWKVSSNVNVPGAFTLSNADQGGDVPEYMSLYEAAQYCRIDYDSFEKLLNDGKLAGTYAEIPVEKWVADEEAYNGIEQQIPDGSPQAVATPVPDKKVIPGIGRVFIKVKLDEWMIAQVG